MLPWPPPGQDDTASRARRGPGGHRGLARRPVARSARRADRARLRLLRPRRHEPGHGDPRVAAARALPDGRRGRRLPAAEPASARRPPRRLRSRAGAHPGTPDRWTCRRRGCAPR
jgi:hypothetical protein